MFAVLALWTVLPVLGGDAFFGRAREVTSGEVVTVNYSDRNYNVRLIGIDVPKEEPTATRAKQFVEKLVLGRNVGVRFDHRTANEEMVSSMFTRDPSTGELLNVGVELVKAGLAIPQKDYDEDKYGELSAAETEAQKAKRGIWAKD